MYRKSGVGYVLVVTEAIFKAETGRKGQDGKEIILDVAFNPMMHALNFATVYQLPIDMGKSPLITKSPGHPGYGPISRPSNLESSPSHDIYAIGNVYRYRYISDIVQEVEIGDKIYFKPRTLNNKANMMGDLKDDKGTTKQYIYKVPYENIFCTVRNGNIKMIGGWILLDPIMEEWGDIVQKTYYPYTDKFGGKIERPKKEWIYKKMAPEHINQTGIIAHVGTPLKGEHCDIEVGMRAVYRKPLKTFFQKIEGVQYIVLNQEYIDGYLTEKAKVS